MDIPGKELGDLIELTDAFAPATPFDQGETLQAISASSWAEFPTQIITLPHTSLKSEPTDVCRPTCTLCLPCLPGEEVIHSAYTQQGLIVLTDYRLVIIRHSSHNTSLSEAITRCNEQVLISPKKGKMWNTYLIARQSIWKVDIIDLIHLRIIIKTGRLLKITFLDCTLCQTWYSYLQTESLYHFANVDPFAAKFKVELSKRAESLDPKFRRLLFEAPQPINVETEFHRLKFPSHLWELKNVNEDYAICKTYPIFHIVPKCITAANIREMALFRQNNRFPSVVWRSVHSGAVLLRCSQPCVGFIGFRNKQDEKFLSAILQCCQDDKENLNLQHHQQSISQSSPLCNLNRRLLIVDARNYSAAFVNCLLGGGYEKIQNYANVDIEWKNLPNQHSVRTSFEKMLVCVHSNVEQWLSVWETTEWPNYLSQLLKASWDIVQTLHFKGNPVLVHCTDGWDRTPQLTSLAQMMLDPYYRTIEGFRVLVDREWLQYGHKFAQRCGLFTHPYEPNEISPVFIQFIDCVHQLCHQYPFEFEFNETFLIKLGVHVYSGLFGTFLCNSLSERSVHHSNTCSVWSFLHPKVNASVRNYLYNPSCKILMPSWSTRDILLWRGMYGDEVNFFVDPHRDNGFGNSCLLVHPTDSFIAFSHDASTGDPSQGLEEYQSFKNSLPTKGDSIPCENLVMTPNMIRSTASQHIMTRSKSLPNVNAVLTDEDANHSSDLDECSFVVEGEISSHDRDAYPTSAELEDDRNSSQIDKIESSIASKISRKAPSKLPQTLISHPKNGVSPGAVLSGDSSLCSSSVDVPSTDSVAPFDAIIERPSTFSGELFVNQVVPLPPASVSQSCACINTLLHGTAADSSHESDGKSKSVILEVQQDWDGLNHISMRVDPYTSYIYLQRQTHSQERQRLQHEVNHWKERLEQMTEEYNSLLQKLDTSLPGQIQLSTPVVDRESDSGMASEKSNSRLNSFENIEKNEIVLWIPDHMSTACGRCGTVFGHFLRKHHCRACGHIFCGQCSNYFMSIPQQNLFASVRVCYNCYKPTQATITSSQETCNEESTLHNVARSVQHPSVVLQSNGSTLYSQLLPFTPWILQPAGHESTRQHVKPNESITSTRSNSLHYNIAPP